MQGGIIIALTIIAASLAKEMQSSEFKDEQLSSTATVNPEPKQASEQSVVEDRSTVTNVDERTVSNTSESGNSTLNTKGGGMNTGEFQGQHIPLLDAVSVKVLVAEEDSIALVDLSTIKRRPLFLERENLNVYSVDFHWSKNLVFFAANNTIFRVDFLPKERNYSLVPIVSQRVGGNVRLAVDWVHETLYWLCDKHQTIEMVDLDGSNRRLLIDNIKHFRFPNNIVVDPFEKLLFFVSDYALFKADLDGSNIRHISVDRNIRSSPDWGIRNIALDRQSKAIFITGKTPQGIYINSTTFIIKIDYKGLGDMENLLPNATQWTDIYGMEVFNDTLYFVDYNNTSVDRLYMVPLLEEKDPPKMIYVPRYTDNGIWSIRVVHPCVQMINNEQCQKATGSM